VLLTIVAFVVALGILIAVHEWGHYRVALACGVKVLRFSIGFGRPLLRWTGKKNGVEFVISALPLGGYVRMLGEGEPVPEAERHLASRAFDSQPLYKRAAVVAAGPLANLLLAVVLLALVNWIGTHEASARIAAPPPGSLLHAAGVEGGARVLRAAFGPAGQQAQWQEQWQDVRSMGDLRWLVTRAGIDRHAVRLQLQSGENSPARVINLDVGGQFEEEPDAAFFERIGILGPWVAPLIAEVMAGGAAERAGLRAGDVVLRVGETPVADGLQLRRLIRTLGAAPDAAGQAQPLPWQVRRGGAVLDIMVQPDVRPAPGGTGAAMGFINAQVGDAPEMVLLRYGPLDGLWAGVRRCQELSLLTLRVLGRMLLGQASLKNISGPLTIADFAGKSAALGLVQYLSFLALISLSLGVLNLLPLPVLDGGKLAAYALEGATGRTVPETWGLWLQRAGVAALALMMGVAMYNDIVRLWG